MEKLTQKIVKLSPENGIKNLNIPGVFTFKNNQSERAEPRLYQPSLVFITSGSKTITLEKHSYKYWEWKFLLVSLSTPFICEAHTEGKEIFAGISIPIDKKELFNLIKELKDFHKTNSKKNLIEPGILSLDITDKIYNAISRLLDCASSEEESKILWPSIVREILFYAVKSPEASNFCDLVLNNKSFWNLWDIVEKINKEYKSDLNIGNLASIMEMSIPTFYRQFKAFTWFSPNQYIKILRLNKAKDLLNKYSVKQVANEVGYNSQFQFSREYKRYFWYAPVKERKL